MVQASFVLEFADKHTLIHTLIRNTGIQHREKTRRTYVQKKNGKWIGL